ncbi:MAG: NAD(P)H-dependent oxidoreductase subunit E [Chloroflexi bacterium]|nr:NAD(P)H-dependent oxidoreductase subunit E [Anaerolineaceae bacterium]NMB88640.1 NAD(P)H-dependent oxidoreductase subunit E [Chloroflexota bacterium]
MNQLLNRYSEEVHQILAKYPPDRKRSAVMPLLYLAQRSTGRVSDQDMADIAEIIEISVTDVASIVGFYTLFHEEPGGRYRIQVCTDLPCALRGADQFLQEVCSELGIGVNQTTPDGLFTVEEVKCLAACHRAPVFQLQGDGEITYHEHQTVETARALFAELRSKSGVQPQTNQEAGDA